MSGPAAPPTLNEATRMQPKKKPVWDKSRPKALGESQALSPQAKAGARAAARAAGRPYPNLVDNMRAASGMRKHSGRGR